NKYGEKLAEFGIGITPKMFKDWLLYAKQHTIESRRKDVSGFFEGSDDEFRDRLLNSTESLFKITDRNAVQPRGIQRFQESCKQMRPLKEKMVVMDAVLLRNLSQWISGVLYIASVYDDETYLYDYLANLRPKVTIRSHARDVRFQTSQEFQAWLSKMFHDLSTGLQKDSVLQAYLNTETGAIIPHSAATHKDMSSETVTAPSEQTDERRSVWGFVTERILDSHWPGCYFASASIDQLAELFQVNSLEKLNQLKPPETGFTPEELQSFLPPPSHSKLTSKKMTL
ncbi:hypothetical protein RFI_07125, partial [Reticulomyxa filosa]